MELRPPTPGGGAGAGAVQYSNPIIPGFFPDPTICRVGPDYYLAASSFEYFPGVPLFHSRDLAHWRQVGNVLTRATQLPLRGAQSSDGIYAPTLRHHQGRFYLATTNRITGEGFRNFFVTATDPAGPWSEPVWIAQGGIDPSLWFDDDGRVYWTANGTGWAPVRGIYQAEIDPVTGARRSEVEFIWAGTGGSYPEAPHLFKRAGWYYLTIAEGGTAEGHMVTIARATRPFGPFEPCPHNPVLSHRSRMTPITSTGHADFFEDHHGDWWVVFLGIRPVAPGFHNLGRETFLAPVTWSADGWPVVHDRRLVTEGMDVDRAIPPQPWPAPPVRDDFAGTALGPEWVFLRNPADDDWSLHRRPGSLWLRCASAAIDDLASPAFVARRQQHFEVRCATWLDFAPQRENEEAGLAAWIDTAHHAEVVVTLRRGHRVALLRRRIGSALVETPPLILPQEGPLGLQISADRTGYLFALAPPGETPREIGRHEVRYLTSEVAGGYTGVVLGIFASARGHASDAAAAFDWFDYEPAGGLPGRPPGP